MVSTDDVRVFREGFSQPASDLEDSAKSIGGVQDSIDKVLTYTDRTVLLCHEIAGRLRELLNSDAISFDDELRDFADKLEAVHEISDEDRTSISKRLTDLSEDIGTTLSDISDACGVFEDAATKAEPAATPIPSQPTPPSPRISPALERHSVS